MANQTGDSGRTLYFARWPVGYGQDPHSKAPKTLKLSRGQAFELDERQPEGNERLERLGFIEPVTAGTQLVTCDECGARFIAVGYREGHYRAVHPEKARRRKKRDAQVEEREAEREEKQLMREAPLYLEKRAAAQTA